MKTFHAFKNAQSFEDFLKSGKYPDCHSGGCLDYVKVGKSVYTMHEYDSAGQSVTWANKRTGIIIEMVTANRYQDGYGDAKIYVDVNPLYIRDDISYAD